MSSKFTKTAIKSTIWLKWLTSFIPGYPTMIYRLLELLSGTIITLCYIRGPGRLLLSWNPIVHMLFSLQENKNILLTELGHSWVTDVKVPNYSCRLRRKDITQCSCLALKGMPLGWEVVDGTLTLMAHPVTVCYGGWAHCASEGRFTGLWTMAASRFSSHCPHIQM